MSNVASEVLVPPAPHPQSKARIEGDTTLAKSFIQILRGGFRAIGLLNLRFNFPLGQALVPYSKSDANSQDSRRSSRQSTFDVRFQQFRVDAIEAQRVGSRHLARGKLSNGIVGYYLFEMCTRFGSCVHKWPNELLRGVKNSSHWDINPKIRGTHLFGD